MPPAGFRSLRWRLTALIGVVLVLAVGAMFVAIYRGTGSALSHQVDSELHADTVSFRHHVPARPSSPPAIRSAAVT
jgi:hypothetical protein